MRNRRYKYIYVIGNTENMVYVLSQKSLGAMSFMIEYMSQLYHVRKTQLYTHYIVTFQGKKDCDFPFVFLLCWPDF